jgi:SAM-dependent MidA family methyltransferase
MDFLSELNPAAEALVRSIGQSLTGGAALFIDYGFPAAEYYHPQRSEGTLMCHYRHRAHADPFLWPGLNDITAHVDFTAIAEAGVAAGLHVAGFAPQALAGAGPADSSAYLKSAASVQQLLSPAEMGELFKVLALARAENIDWKGFALVDRSGRL